jgi:aminomethyltransferase
MELKTPLYNCHIKYGGRIVPYAGFLLPVQYNNGIIKEHLAVRNKCGLFDVSHMSEMFFEGKDALANIQYIFANDFSSMAPGQVRYTTMLNVSGGIVDDLIVYKLSDTSFMAVGNGSNRQKDRDWISSHISGDCQFIDRSDEYALIALQGPMSVEILHKLANQGSIPPRYFTFREGNIADIGCIISQTGYTGEFGYELYTSPDKAESLWEALLEAGAESGIIPCGLGARDTLRLEASLVLYGHELTDDITPLEANLRFSVKFGKDNFIGKSALADCKDISRTLACFKITGKGIVREHNDMYIGGSKVGFSTSGTHAPYFGYPIAMGYIDKAYYSIGAKVVFNVRGRDIEGEIVNAPFYKKASRD